MDVRFKNPTLDRIWLGLIGLAFLVMAPIWVILSVERLGWRLVAAALYLALVYRFAHRSESS